MAIAPPAITCERCKQGTMHAERLPRMSSGPRALGYILCIGALLVLASSVAWGLLVGRSTTNAVVQGVEEAREDAANQLREFAMLPSAEVDNFLRTGKLTDAALAALRPEDRSRVDAILSSYTATVARTALGSTAATSTAGVVAAGLVTMSLVLFVVGVLLTLKKNVWRCSTCGYAFDRA